MVTLLQIEGRYVIPDKKTFLISSAEDVAILPTSKKSSAGHKICAPGSTAYTADLSFVAILGNDDVWHEVLWENT